MAYPTMRTQAQCPNCGTPVTINVQQVVDVGEEPALRDRLLRGRLNVLRCPQCGFAAPVSSPMIYHDPAHSLLLAFVPQELQLPMAQEEKEIGRLTNMLLDKTAPEQRKMYMLEPTRVLTYDALMEKILEAEGIDPQAMRRQSERVRLLVSMAQAANDPAALDAMIARHRDELDREMVAMTTATIAQAREMGDESLAAPYVTLRAKLIEALGIDEGELTISPEQARDQIIDLLGTLTDDELREFVQVNRPVLDYPFFLHLADRADAAEGEEGSRLAALRERLLAETEALDNEAEAAMRRAAGQLQRLLQAKDVEAELQEMIPEIDEAFIVVLSANIEQARAQGQEEIAELLMRLYSRVMQAIQAGMRPELQTMNELVQIEDPAQRAAALREAMGRYDPNEFVALIEEVASSLEDAGRGDPIVLDRLYAIADEARSMLAGAPASGPATAAPKAPPSGILLP